MNALLRIVRLFRDVIPQAIHLNRLYDWQVAWRKANRWPLI